MATPRSLFYFVFTVSFLFLLLTYFDEVNTRPLFAAILMTALMMTLHRTNTTTMMMTPHVHPPSCPLLYLVQLFGKYKVAISFGTNQTVAKI